MPNIEKSTANVASDSSTVRAVEVQNDESTVSSDLGDAIAFHLRLAQEASFRAFAKKVNTSDLRPGYYSMLTLIDSNPGISQTALGLLNGRDKSSLTPVLDALKKRGFIVRRRPANNRRRYALYLTDRGREALDILRTHASAHDKQLDGIVGIEHKAELIRLLHLISSADL